MARFGETKEMTNAELFLSSDESSFRTGAGFFVDGGTIAAHVMPE